jgi:hypothetical protein
LRSRRTISANFGDNPRSSRPCGEKSVRETVSSQG